MHANLVSAPGFQLSPQQRVRPKAALYTEVRNGFPAIGPNCHAGARGSMATDGFIHRSSARHHALADGDILPLDLASRECSDERCMRLDRTRDHKQAARIFVQAMHETGSRYEREARIHRQQRVLKRMPGITGAGMNYQTRRLVDDEQRAVLMNHGDGEGFRLDPALRFEAGFDTDLFAAQHLIFRAGGSAIDENRARLDPALQPGAGILGQRSGERLIETQAGATRRQGQVVSSELHVNASVPSRQGGFRYTAAKLYDPLATKGPVYPMPLFGLARSGVLLVLVGCLAMAGCRTNRDRDLTQSGPDIIYKQAHQRLMSYDYNAAIKGYEALNARFPFTDQARQARLDLIYAYYRAGETESAIDAAETFVRENPTHPRVDYAWYIKGLVDFERTPNVVERFFRVDLTERPPATARKAFAAFRTVVEQYPKSEYAHDARQRMIYLRNRLADYETHVAEYYMRREAYVAAAQRAKNAIEQYDGAPAVKRALEIMITAYEKMDLDELAAQTKQVYAANFGSEQPRNAENKPWWKIW